MIKYNKFGFSIVEVLVSIVILSIFLIGAYTGINNFYNVINYIDSNINGLNMTKSSVDEVINVRNKFFSDYPSNGWEKFAEKYSTGTYIFSKTKCALSDNFFCKIVDKRENYEGPLDNLGNITDNINGTYFYKKIDIGEANKFYLKNIDRTNIGTGEILKLKFTDSIYNEPSFVISGDFENNDLEVLDDGLDIDYYDLNGTSGSREFNNLNNNNLRYSKIISYGNTPISDGDYFTLSYSGGLLIKKIIFYSSIIPRLNSGEIPLKIDTNSIDQNYYNLCNEIDKINGLSCDYNFFLKDNFYKKLIGIDKKLSSIDFGADFNFSFSGINNNEIWIYLSGSVLPDINNFLYINPYSEIRHNNNNSNDNDFLSVISDSTAGKGVIIPDKAISVGATNTSTGYTSLLNIKTTTFLYDKNEFIDNYEVETKIGDINRYQDYYENK